MEKRNVFDILKERGFVEQVTHEENCGSYSIKSLLLSISALTLRQTVYMLGICTNDSYGTYAKSWPPAYCLIRRWHYHGWRPQWQNGHEQMLTQEEINDNAEKFKVQFQRLIDFSDDKAIMDNNANWLLDLNYVKFLRR